ncbi:hypothetical protein [Aliiglaciecola litoralis]|uniref:Lipoprotein n=1 Tax=Aliiglaciecola litoralis TaxID=582857 RepID=A0ABP3WMB6_9ALTE
MNTSHRIFVYLLLNLMVISCAGISIKGKVEDGHYYSPLNNFSVPLRKAMGLRIQDQNDADGGRVSFPDDWGYLEAITYVRIPAADSAMFTATETRDQAYRTFISEYAMPVLFRSVSNEAEIIHEEFLGESSSRNYFAIVNIPNGSVTVDVKTNKRLDSVRGLLIFDKKGFIYMLESEMSYAVNPITAASNTSKQIGRTLTTLQNLKDSMIFK